MGWGVQKGTETTQQTSASDRRETSLIGDLLSNDRARSAVDPPASPPSDLMRSTHGASLGVTLVGPNCPQ